MKRTTYKDYIIDTDNLGRTYIYYTGSPFSEDSDKIVLGFTTLKEAKEEINNKIEMKNAEIIHRISDNLAEEVEALIKQEYEENGWIIEVGFDKACGMWNEIEYQHGKLSSHLYDETNDCYQDEDQLQDIISKCLKKYAQINIDKLAKEEK